MTLLEVHCLSRDFTVRGFFGRGNKILRAVDDVSFSVAEAEILGIVGETGSGKSTLAKMIAGIQQPSSGWVSLSGEIVASRDLKLAKPVRAKLQYIYQDPSASLDPRWTLKRSLHEPLITHTDLSPQLREEKILKLMADLELPSALLDRYPHEVSGGQQRRVGLARVLLLAPKFVIFDEPTSGLDVLVQAAVLKLLRDLRQEFGLTYLFISHDITVVSSICDRVAVMHNGSIVEIGPVNEVLVNPKHPHTRALLAASLRIGGARLTDDPPAPRERET